MDTRTLNPSRTNENVFRMAAKMHNIEASWKKVYRKDYNKFVYKSFFFMLITHPTSGWRSRRSMPDVRSILGSARASIC